MKEHIGWGLDEQGVYRVLRDDITQKISISRQPEFCKFQPFQMKFNMEDTYDAKGRKRGAFHKKAKI